MAAEPRPVPEASEHLEDIERKYGHIRFHLGRQVTAAGIPQKCGLALIMALVDLVATVAEQDGISAEAVKRVNALWARASFGDRLPDVEVLKEALGEITQPTGAQVEARKVKQDAVWLGNVVPAGLA